MTQANWPYPRLIAHRGGGRLAPENTLAALKLGIERGYRMAEFDVMLSRDHVALLIHDETLARTTDGEGRVCEHSADALARLDAGGWFGAEFAGEAIPRLDQAAALCRQADIAVNVEIKPAQGFEALTGRIVAEQAAQLWAGATLPPLLSSFSLAALWEARAAAPHLPRALLFDQVPPDWRGLQERLGAVALHCNARHLLPDTLQSAKAAGIPVACWTVNDVKLAQSLFAAGVSAVFTDELDLLRALG
ncbi:MAG: glycerophosphodiester phosphodiesterase [Rhodocyclaceae bacterium]|nr:glycerophosphodiester phosphodiesterase [Rhodocyclaceae bacterium]MBX3669766.1 glycerophosphodiester phosphodiesterase [Rhodocyclaceae bacterium]